MTSAILAPHFLFSFFFGPTQFVLFAGVDICLYLAFVFGGLSRACNHVFVLRLEGIFCLALGFLYCSSCVRIPSE